MKLSGQQRRQLQEALIDAFPTTASLEQMLAFELDKNLRTIAGEESLKDIVFKLIQAADSQGWVEHLIWAACQSNNGNLSLKAIAKELLTSRTSSAPPAPSLEPPTKPTPRNQEVGNRTINKKSIIVAITIILGLGGSVWFSHIVTPHIPSNPSTPTPSLATSDPQATKNNISNFRAASISPKQMDVTVDYTYIGNQEGNGNISIRATPLKDDGNSIPRQCKDIHVKNLGSDTGTISLYSDFPNGTYTTTKVKVDMLRNGSKILSSQTFPYEKVWQS